MKIGQNDNKKYFLNEMICLNFIKAMGMTAAGMLPSYVYAIFNSHEIKWIHRLSVNFCLIKLHFSCSEL